MYKLGLHKRRCLSLVYRSGNGHNWLATSSIFPTSFHPPRPDALTHTAWPDDTGWAARATVGEASSFAGYNHSLLVNDHRYKHKASVTNKATGLQLAPRRTNLRTKSKTSAMCKTYAHSTGSTGNKTNDKAAIGPGH